jgi:hypothetical protein
MNNLLIKNNNNPYYIYAPSYAQTSMGIKILHHLCHYLNLKGYPAFLFDFSRLIKFKVNPQLISPILNENVINCHREANLSPIVVYPDVVNGNPLNSNNVVRYILNYAGLLGGQKDFNENELIYCYTKKISDKIDHKNKRILFMPPLINEQIFYQPENDSKRSGGCYYGAKYKEFHKQKTFPFTDNLIEITRDKKDSHTTKQIGELFRNSEFFVAYEDTSLITESLLCGCPAILLKNNFFDGTQLAEFELSKFGSTNNIDVESIKNARKEIPLFLNNYRKASFEFENQFENFIKDTQNFSLNKNFPDLKQTFKKDESIGRFFKKKIIKKFRQIQNRIKQKTS